MLSIIFFKRSISFVFNSLLVISAPDFSTLLCKLNLILTIYTNCNTPRNECASEVVYTNVSIYTIIVENWGSIDVNGGYTRINYNFLSILSSVFEFLRTISFRIKLIVSSSFPPPVFVLKLKLC